MMQFPKQPKRSPAGRARRGFTLVELIAAVAIVAILASLGIPAVTNLQNNYKVTELDSVARQIFVAAQNKASGMLALDSFSAFDESVMGTPYRGGKMTAVSASAPADFDTAGGAEYTDAYHYTKHNTLDPFCDLLPAGSIDDTVLNGCYVIEYNSTNGEIYGVFYAEADFTYDAAVFGLRDTELASNKTARRDHDPRLGYYGGAASKSIDSKRSKAPEFALINDEELYLLLKGETAADYTVNYTLTIEDGFVPGAKLSGVFPFTAATGAPASIALSGAGDVTLGGISITAEGKLKIVLDSLADTLHYRQIFANAIAANAATGAFAPGHDLIVRLTATRRDTPDKGIVYLESDPITAQQNSLFQGLTASVSGNAATDDVRVTYARHLQNLEPSLSGYAPDGKAAGTNAATVFQAAAAQTQAIDWKGKWGVLTPAPLAFTPITNDRLASYTGQGNAIKNLNLSENQPAGQSACAGLFGTFSGSKLEKIRLVDPAYAPVSGTAQYAGMLAGRVDAVGGTEIDDCLVYATATDVGGVKTVNPDCKLEAPASAAYIGGLVGSMTGGSIADSAASLPVLSAAEDPASAGRYIGGLAGKLNETALQRCYANTGLMTVPGKVTDYAGGLFGQADSNANKRIQYAYALGAITNGANATAQSVISGLGNVNGMAVNDCYAAATYTDIAPTATVYGFCGTYAPAANGDDNCYFLRTDGITEFSNPTGSSVYGTPLTYDELAAAPNAPGRLNTTYFVKAAAADDVQSYSKAGLYPFPLLKDSHLNESGGAASTRIVHYGDWPGWTGAKYLVYYEQYGTDAYAFHDASGKVVIKTEGANGGVLPDNTKTIVADGYAILGEVGTGSDLADETYLHVRYTDKDGKQTVTLEKSTGTLTDDADATVKYNVYFFRGVGATADKSGITLLANSHAVLSGATYSFYHKYTAGGYNFYCNPSFADTAHTQDTLPNDPGTAANPVLLRTARQLKLLGLSTSLAADAPYQSQSIYWNRNWVFRQGHTIDFSTYGAYAAAYNTDYYKAFHSNYASASAGRSICYCDPIGNGTTAFRGKFQSDGENTIRFLEVATNAEGAYTGLFGKCENTDLSNVYLVNACVQGTGRPKAVGQLAAYISGGSITGCRAYFESAVNPLGETADPWNTVSGTTTYQLVASGSPDDDTKRVESAGGLIGHGEFLSAIQDSFASLTGFNLLRVQRAGGFLGSLSGSAGVSNCYANVNLQHSESTDIYRIFMPGFRTERCERVGGFAGSLSGTVTCCYAMGEIASAGDPLTGFCAAGFAGENLSNLTHSYAAVAFSLSKNGLGMGFTYENLAAGAGCYYTNELAGISPNAVTGVDAVAYADLGTIGAVPGLSGACFINATVTATTSTVTPYTITLASVNTYPFLQLKLAGGGAMIRHYGDWPAPMRSTYRLVYYETYGQHGNASWTQTHVYDADAATQTYRLASNLGAFSLLSGAHTDYYLKKDGYAFMYEGVGTDTISVAYNSTAAAPPATTVTLSRNTVTVTKDADLSAASPAMVPVSLYYLDSLTPAREALTGGIGGSSFYSKLTLSNRDYYYNPDFAKTGLNSAAALPAEPATVFVRSARQLANLGNEDLSKTFYWARTCTYLQELDVDFAKYDAPLSMAPIGTHKATNYPFAANCTYDGGYNRITGVSIAMNTASDSYVGLFGYNEGTLQNIVFLADTVREITGYRYIGGLVGYNDNQGTIRNCAVGGFNISGDSYVGGFVGYNNGSITGCCAVNFQSGSSGGSIDRTRTSKIYFGGFAGNAASGSIANSYAIATLAFDDTAATAGKKGFAGGVTAAPTNCYCASTYGANQWAHFDANNSNKSFNGNNAPAIRNMAGSMGGKYPADVSFSYAVTGTFPFPAVITSNGSYVHYGNWPSGVSGSSLEALEAPTGSDGALAQRAAETE